MDELVTTSLILNWLKEQVENKRPISPELYLDAAMKLNLLKSDDNDRLIELEHVLAMTRAEHVREGGTSAAAKINLEADPLFMEVQKLKSKLKQVEEAIRIAKLSARIKNDELANARFS
jgi:hypothetical protein